MIFSRLNLRWISTVSLFLKIAFVMWRSSSNACWSSNFPWVFVLMECVSYRFSFSQTKTEVSILNYSMVFRYTVYHICQHFLCFSTHYLYQGVVFNNHSTRIAVEHYCYNSLFVGFISANTSIPTLPAAALLVFLQAPDVVNVQWFNLCRVVFLNYLVINNT